MSVESAIALIESVKDHRVLFVGDNIKDEYWYVQQLGKAAKEYLIPLKYLSTEVFDGGVLAAAKHARSFCKSVDVVYGPKAVRKVRMVDQNSLQKLSEIHFEEDAACTLTRDGVYDAIVVADFGHGTISSADAKECTDGDFIAVSTQTNSANRGFNLITKYPRADYIVIDEPEARLAAADQHGHIEDVIHKLAHGRCERFVVTHGKHGAYGYDHGKFIHIKTRSDLVRDTMGAGDAFFAITAPLAKHGTMEDLLLIGNAAGALKCNIVGHRASVTKEALVEYLRAHS
jgi:bifunctional ADP-heptose synthase (sugar kinase/adenylyltransferase)